ncbi:MAG: methyltransferase [Marmoricola sp.]|jgi:adenine-specific DNA-methyltransferase|nr:methyltransferase [Marmoricola sp.]
MIKYLGSKRLLVGVLGDIATATGASTAVDLFTGTTRVAQELKRRGVDVTASDIATYSEVFSDCYIATDAETINKAELDEALEDLNSRPGKAGYVTQTFCTDSRFFQPHNGKRIDAIRDAIDADYSGSPLRPVLLTSLIDAADRVDSTTGLQMAYLKGWSPRSHDDLQLRMPDLIPGPGTTIRGDAREIVQQLPRTELAYLDPPYNQHRYFTNYHVWETLVRWDKPDHYGIACKRADARDEDTKSVFNRKRDMPDALHALILDTRADVVVVSYNDESWVTAEEMTAWLSQAGHESVGVLAFDSKRYVGAQIGIYNGKGLRVGTPQRLRNQELVFVAGPDELVRRALTVTR